MTQSFCILAVLWGLISTAFLVMSCIPSLSAPGRGPIVSTFMAFAGGEDSVLGLGGGEGCVCWDLVSCCRGAEPTLVSPSPALSLIVAMTVYTIERWNQPGNPQVQSFFSWSFYLGWVSTLLFLCTGDCDCCLGSSGVDLGGAGWGAWLEGLAGAGVGGLAGGSDGAGEEQVSNFSLLPQVA